MRRPRSLAKEPGIRQWWRCGAIKCHSEFSWAAWGWPPFCSGKDFYDCIKQSRVLRNTKRQPDEGGTGRENIMRRVGPGAISFVFFIFASCAMAVAQTQSPSLGDYARSVKKSKPQEAKTAKVYDNDTMHSATTISVVG